MNRSNYLIFFLLSVAGILGLGYALAYISTVMESDLNRRYLLSKKDQLKLREFHHPTLGWDHSYDTPYGSRPHSYLLNHPRPAEDTIATFGSGHTYGDNTSRNDTWQSILSHYAQQPIANFGVPEYGIDQVLLKAEGSKYRFKKTILLLSPEIITPILNRFPLFRGEKLKYTLPKPRFIVKDNVLTLLENPLKNAEDIHHGGDADVVHTWGAYDWWYEVLVPMKRDASDYRKTRFRPEIWDMQIGQQLACTLLERFSTIPPQTLFVLMPDAEDWKYWQDKGRVSKRYKQMRACVSSLGVESVDVHLDFAQQKTHNKRLGPYFKKEHATLFAHQVIARSLSKSLSDNKAILTSFTSLFNKVNVPGTGHTVYYYDLVAPTPKELVQEIRRKGPLDNKDKRRSAFTSWNIRWTWPRKNNGSPQFDKTTASLSVTVYLPRWITASLASEEAQAAWNSYITALIKHERVHIQNAITTREVVEQHLRSLSPTQTTPEEANKIAHRLLENARERDRAYDKRTKHGIREGASFSLLRAQ